MTCFTVTIVGRSGSGKTTLITRLLSFFSSHKIKIGSIKHTHHQVEFDKPGKDSWEHRKAGADLTMAISQSGFALFGSMEKHKSLPEIIQTYFQDYTLVLAEGFKKDECDLRIEVHRQEVSQTALFQSMKIDALASDYLPEQSTLHFPIDEVEQIAHWILSKANLKL